jgi:hypothetical protein
MKVTFFLVGHVVRAPLLGLDAELAGNPLAGLLVGEELHLAALLQRGGEGVDEHLVAADELDDLLVALYSQRLHDRSEGYRLREGVVLHVVPPLLRH